MKKIFSLIFLSLLVQSVWSQSGVGYDPQSPGDPDVYYSLEVEASPRSGGSISPSSRQKLSFGESVYCCANAKAGYKFKNWMIGDSLVSANYSMYFTMPDQDVVLTAHFDWIGNEDYNPQNPGDPFADGYQHKVTLYATPSVGGSFNSSSFYLTEGESTNVYAYSSVGYRFVSWKQNGIIISTSNPMQIKMGTENQEYTAQFVYDPENPGNPSPNSFNPATGELIIDEFTTGRLNNAISYMIGGSDNYHLIQSIKIIGRMSSSDFGFSYRLSNCSLFDLARTTGYTEIPRWSFEDLSSLTKIIMPSSIERICTNAFYGCGSLSEIVCYATVPPVLESGAFNNIPSGLIVRVPSSSLLLYTKSEGWQDFTIMPLDEETCKIGVSLPSDAGDGRYKNMTLELHNISSGQIIKYLITDRTKYTFSNLVRDTKYNLFVKNASGSILGSIQNIEVADKDVNVSFTTLLQPQNVVLNVLADNKSVTNQVTISWMDTDGKYIGQGNNLTGIIEGSKLVYQISLPQSLGSEYIAPSNTEYIVTSTTNNIICTLQPFETLQVAGHISDVSTGSIIRNATITLSQRLNGKYSKSQTINTDNEGNYSATIYNAPLSVTISANKYLSQTIEIDDVSNSSVLNEVFLEGITGPVITTNFTYQKSTYEGVTPVIQNYYSDYVNISYAIFDATTGKEIKDFNVQYPSIVLLENISVGDRLRIVASSKNKSFVDVVAEGIVDTNNHVDITFPIVQLGGIEVYASSLGNSENVGVLYDSKGKFVRKVNYSGYSLNITDLLDGNYTIVSMGNSKFFNTILSISDISNSGLEENKDYVLSTVTIESGKTTYFTIDEIPFFDETKFYFTGSNTLFSSNKPSVTIGNYITLRASVDFKEDYQNAISDVKLIFDLPENCNFVENSLLAGKGIGNYSVEKNRICVDNVQLNDPVRFCIIPTVGSVYKPSAFVQFKYKDVVVLQPIGVAQFEAKNLSINIPSITILPIITVSGTATSNSSVKIFDNNVQIGETVASPNGIWKLNCNLLNAYSPSYHNIKATATTENGQILQTDIVQCYYDENEIVAKTVEMFFYNAYTNKTEKVVFDIQNESVSTPSYSFYTTTDITFVANLSINDPNSVSAVAIKVLTDKQHTKVLHANYDSNKDCWVAKEQFTSDELPVGVEVAILSNKKYTEDRDLFNKNRNLLNEEIRINREITDSLYTLYGLFTEIVNNQSSREQFVNELIEKLENTTNSEERSQIIKEFYEYIYGSKLEIEYEIVENISSDSFRALLSSVDSLIEQSNANNATIDEVMVDEKYDQVLKNELNDLIKMFEEAQKENIVFDDEGLSISMSVMSLNDFEQLHWDADKTKIPMNDGSSIILYVCGKDIAIIDSLNNEVRTICIELSSSAAPNRAITPADILSSLQRAYDNMNINLKNAIQGVNIFIEQVKNDLKSIEEEMKSFESQRAITIRKRAEMKAQIADLERARDLLIKKTSPSADWSDIVRRDNQIHELEKSVATTTKKIRSLDNIISGYEKSIEARKMRQIAKMGILTNALSLIDILNGFYVLYDYSQTAFSEYNKWRALIDVIEPCPEDQEKAEQLYNRCNDDLERIMLREGYVPAISISAVSSALSICGNVNKLNIAVRFVTSLLSPYVSGVAKMFYNNANTYSHNRYNQSWLEIKELKCEKNLCDEHSSTNAFNYTKVMNRSANVGLMNANEYRNNSSCKEGGQCICPFGYCLCKDCEKEQVKPIRDPSGYVYEGVSSNRLEGVTATAYYKEQIEDMYSDLHDNIVKWDAEEYAQENPLFTDENGMYQWDVPQGLWQVKFEKEGYVTTYSDWLPVPPPQLDVNVAMKQVRQPEIKSVHAYKDGVEIEFDKYMIPETLSPDNIYVTVNGELVEGEVAMLNEEISYEGEETKYVSKVRFIPQNTITSSDLTLTITNKVMSYAGIRMQDNYQQTFDIEQELTAIKVDSVVNVAYHGALTLTVSVVPAEASAGKTLYVKSSSSMIASVGTDSIALDNDGMASIVVVGELPGSTSLTYSIDGYTPTAQTIVKVDIVSIETCAMPTASVASSSVVEKGTAIELSCATVGATIFYTFDGSCPCNETDARKIYDGTPIIINEDVTIKAMAMAPNMYESDIAEFTYFVDGNGIDNITINGGIQIYPLPVRDKINITAGGKTIKNVTVSSMNGIIVASVDEPAPKITLDVNSIPAGIYIINVITVDSTFSCKILKVD